MAIPRFQMGCVRTQPDCYTWRFLGANNKPLAMSPTMFRSSGEAEVAITTLRDGIDQSVIELHYTMPNYWMWRLKIGNRCFAQAIRGVSHVSQTKGDTFKRLVANMPDTTPILVMFMLHGPGLTEPPAWVTATCAQRAALCQAVSGRGGSSAPAAGR